MPYSYFEQLGIPHTVVWDESDNGLGTVTYKEQGVTKTVTVFYVQENSMERKEASEMTMHELAWELECMANQEPLFNRRAQLLAEAAARIGLSGCLLKEEKCYEQQQ